MSARLEVSYQRAGAFAWMAGLLRDLGTDPADVSRGLDIDLDAVTADSRLVFADCLTLLERAAELTGCAHFGLLLGARYPWRAHGLIHDLASHAPTLRQAMLDFVTWQLGYCSGAVVYLLPMGDDVAFGYGIYGGNSPGSRQLYQVCVAIGCAMIRELSNGEVAPAEIQFAYDKPADIAPYRQILHATPRFNQLQSCLVLSAATLGVPRPAANPVERARLIATMDSSFDAGPGATSRKLRHLLRPQLLGEDASMPAAASVMGIAPRTLRRRLLAEGLTFEAVRDDVRFAVARELLEMTRLPVGDVSAALAFASHSAFDQAFRRWSGTSPSAWRRQFLPGNFS
ncbi:AraC family transcriptional regulator [Polymorphobacter arshaanensis]|uniref:AraC family transcriptional regulator n=1 Tax=Glacieibacterium arshaanense TaxID=2511025 RepID=A0A4Y9EMB3_9SPHN|nr:AraC family transcriptional regulator [Polymorphobacter arshaanensis]TFU03148.1 AraC family transcriptional regulator [Polymorphobacter arshaanensis]